MKTQSQNHACATRNDRTHFAGAVVDAQPPRGPTLVGCGGRRGGSRLVRAVPRRRYGGCGRRDRRGHRLRRSAAVRVAVRARRLFSAHVHT